MTATKLYTEVDMLKKQLAEETKEKMPLIDQDMVQGAMWDPDAGLVIPRSQTVAGKLVDQAEASGELQVFQNTEATGFKIAEGRIQAVETIRGTIAADAVVVCAGLWGRLVAQMAGEDLPIMPVDHPLSCRTGNLSARASVLLLPFFFLFFLLLLLLLSS